MSYCRKCGLELTQDDNFCPKCGTKVTIFKENNGVNNDTTEPSKNNTTKTNKENESILPGSVSVNYQKTESIAQKTSENSILKSNKVLIPLGIAVLAITSLIVLNSYPKASTPATTQQTATTTTVNSPKAAPVAPSKSMARITGTDVRIRQGPGTYTNILGYYALNEPVEIIDKSNDWIKVRRSNGDVGWVSAQYCHKDGEKVENVATQRSMSAKITGNRVWIRKHPSWNTQVLGHFNDNEEVELIEDRDPWRKVKRKNGQIAWVISRYCRRLDEKSFNGRNPYLFAEVDKFANIDKAKAGFYKMPVDPTKADVERLHGRNYSLDYSSQDSTLLFNYKNLFTVDYWGISKNTPANEYSAKSTVRNIKVIRNNGIRTKDGIGVGDAESLIEKTYGYIDFNPSNYDGVNKYYFSHGPFSLIFTAKNGIITSIVYHRTD